MADVDPGVAADVPVQDVWANMMDLPLPLLLAYITTITTASTCVYKGSLLGIDSGSNIATERMTSTDVWQFPFIGSAVLLSLYLAFKYVAKSLVNALLSLYFIGFGVVAMTATFSPYLERVFPSRNRRPYRVTWTPLWNSPSGDWSLEFTYTDAWSFVVASAVGVVYWMSKHWVLNNVLAIAFGVQGIALLQVGDMGKACVLLGGLFIYDIIWVFGTDVMVSVATNVEGPIKLMVPRDVFAAEYRFSMLGLGDIVIPGVLVAMLLRFDRFRQPGVKRFSRTYFLTCFYAYVAGLITTVVIMHSFRSAQPALLYLVPFTLGAVLLLAVARGELKALFAYEDESDDEASETGTASTQKKKK
jgi:minor histocompatibility antigen H13